MSEFAKLDQIISNQATILDTLTKVLEAISNIANTTGNNSAVLADIDAVKAIVATIQTAQGVETSAPAAPAPSEPAPAEPVPAAPETAA